VRFKDAVERTPDLQDAWRRGFQALLAADRRHVEAEATRRLAGSVNVDAALAEDYPNEPRWDYAVGHRPANGSGEVVYWIEIHPASSGEVSVVLNKLAWLKRWLQKAAPELRAMRKSFVWVSSGRTSFTLSSPQQKQFALHGLRHTGRVFVIPDKVTD
jgi:hypothetical protein